MSLRRWSDARRRRPRRAARATVLNRALSCSARAQIFPGTGRALRRRSVLKPSPAPASKARCLTATLGDILGNALAGRRLERQANTLACSSSISFYFSPTHFPPPDMLGLASFPYHGGCHANGRAFIVPCITEPCAGFDTAHVLGRRAVWSTYLHTRGRGDMQTLRHADGSVAALNRECQSLTLLQSLFGHSKSSPAPRSSACIGVAGPRARGAG